MPILWRYLLSDYLKISITCVIAFIALLLTMQLDDIAHFAALGAPAHYVILFTFYQIPYIFPIALPLSCLIAAYLQVQRLSASHELTAARASGYGLPMLFLPIWLLAILLSFGNFWMTSELATYSHLQNNLLKNELRSINPLLLLHNKHLMRLKGYYFEALGSSHVGESSEDVIIALPNHHHQRIHLMLAKELRASSEELIGKGVTLITGIATDQEKTYDQLLVENTKNSIISVSDFSDMLQKKIWTVHNDYLQISLLLARIEEQKEEIRKEQNKEELKKLNTHLNKSQSEIVKRGSLAMAVFSFTFMGTAFGSHIGRRKTLSSLFLVIILATFYLISFFVAKGVDHQFFLASSFYLVPHLIIFLFSFIYLMRLSKGIE